MFVVKRKTSMPKVLKNIKFKTYEEARQAIRKYLRTKAEFGKKQPAISEFGFAVVKM